MTGYYDFQDLLNTAEDEDTLEAWGAVADWLSCYDMESWNGECWDLGNGTSLRPEYGEPINDVYPIIGYTVI